MRLASFTLPLVFCLVLFMGCSPSSNVSGLVPADGKVLLDGKPIDDVNITFMPVAGSDSDRYAMATSKSDGSFQTRTLDSNGILPGKYAVTLSKKTVVSKVTREELTRIKMEGGRSPDPDITYIVPAKYGNAKTSGFTLEIDASGKKDILFELTN